MKTICVIESPEHFHALRKRMDSKREALTFFCSSSESQSLLDEAGIPYISLTEDLFAGEWEEINTWAKTASLRWFRDPPFSEALTVEGLNLGDIFNRLISHALIYRLKNQWLADYLLEHFSFDGILIFDLFVRKGSRWVKDSGSINDFLDRRLRNNQKAISKLSVHWDVKESSWVKEWVRRVIGFIYTLTNPLRRVPSFVGRGALKHLLPLLSRLQDTDPTAFIDENFHFEAYKACEQKQISYVLVDSLIPWMACVRLGKKLKRLRPRLENLVPLIDASPWFSYKNKKIDEIGNAVLDTLLSRAEERLRQKLLLEFLRRKGSFKALLLHEDVDLLRTSALAARQLDLPVVVLSHGIPPTPSDWSEAAAGIGVADVIVNSAFERDKYLQTGYSPELLHVLGLPRFDLIHQRVREKSEHVSAIKTVLYCPHMLTRVTKRKKGYLGIHTPGGVTRRNSIEVMKACQKVGCKLVIKPHANSQDMDLWHELIEQQGDENMTLAPSHSDILSLIDSCDLVVTTFSTVVIEAMLFDKNAITLNFTQRPDLHPYAGRGIALGVYEAPLLAESIQKCLFDPKTNDELRRNREREREYFGGVLDGKNTDRVAAFIRSLQEHRPEEKWVSAWEKVSP